LGEVATAARTAADATYGRLMASKAAVSITSAAGLGIAALRFVVDEAGLGSAVHECR